MFPDQGKLWVLGCHHAKSVSGEAHGPPIAWMLKRIRVNGSFHKLPSVTCKATAIVVSFLVALQIISADQLNAYGDKLAVLKVGNEIYSNVAVTLVTGTDIYFSHSRGMGNAKLEDLSPELQTKFRFNAKKALETKNEQKQANARFKSWISQQTNNRPVRIELAPVASVEVAEPVVNYRYYTPRTQLDRPAELQEGMTGNTQCSFTCDTDIDVRPTQITNGEPIAFRFESIKLSVGLPMTLTLPLGASQKLKDHEEGHRRINEYFYAFGRKAAERAIQVALTNRFNYDTKDFDLRKAMFVGAARMMIENEYWKYTKFPSRPANVYYDELTDHGRNDVDSAEAAQKAIQRYAVEVEGTNP